MPRIVNHEERRRQVARVARDLILQCGIDNVTVREIASLAGYSTAVVSHYFRNKKELMFLVFTETQRRSETRFRAAINAGVPVLEGLEALLPRDDESRDFWRVWFA
ncbi:MAG: TetR/AcrR family transcriptional regulator, partial [Porticoccaceae bacterium]|nr:TetR/AcrR family transcriptional regulator [Porticoccaceae bacterium]